MIELTHIRPVFEHGGPYATVYLERAAPGEDSAEQTRLRWNALRSQLDEAGAPAKTLTALDEQLAAEQPGEQQADGRVLVVAEGDVLLAEPWDAAFGAGDSAHWSAQPELGAYLRESARAVRVLVVIADQQGAEVRQEVIAEQHEPTELRAEDVHGGAHEGVHKPRGGALSHNRIQRRAAEAVRQNVKDVVAHLRTVASTFRPRVLVLAGEVQARTALRDGLPDELSGIVVETESGGRDAHASDEALADELLRSAAQHSAEEAHERTERFHTGLAHQQAVHGTQQVAEAAERGAVETVLFQLDLSAPGEAELLRACAETDAGLALVDEDTGLKDNVGALLRFPVNA